MRHQDFSPEPVVSRTLHPRRRATAAVLLSPVLVALLTLVLHHLRSMISTRDMVTDVHPLGVVYVLPIVIITLIGGQWPGILTLCLSLIGLVGFVAHDSIHGTLSLRDWLEVIAVVSIGTAVIFGITEYRIGRELLAISEEARSRIRAIMDIAPAGIIITDTEGRVRYANREAARIWGDDVADVTVVHWQDRDYRNANDEPIPPKDRPLSRVLAGQSIETVNEMRDHRPDGRVLWIEQRAALIRSDYGRPQGAIVIISDIDNRKAAEQDLRKRVAREVFVNRVGAIIRSAEQQDVVQRVAQALGDMLQCDQCYFVLFDYADGVAKIAPGWHLSAARTGTYSLKQFTELEHGGFAETVRVTDNNQPGETVFPPRLWHRAEVVVPMHSGTRISSLLVAAMDNEPRSWTDEEVALAELVAAQTLAAVEAARLRAREHHIASTLQESLTPSHPKSLPGLKAASYYAAALDEASIGGDFLDVFELHPNCHAVVLGDVSGKGLAAATQVATVRMMLRYALARDMDLVRGISLLSDTLAKRDWLVGFATSFVSVFDVAANSLSYISCGHEPALVRRAATGAIEQLASTGAALGAFEGAMFSMNIVPLMPGDVLVLYTDGASEAGHDRQECLGPDGLQEILSDCPSYDDPGVIVDCLIAGINKYARGLLRDDVCLLVTIATGLETAAVARGLE